MFQPNSFFKLENLNPVKKVYTWKKNNKYRWIKTQWEQDNQVYRGRVHLFSDEGLNFHIKSHPMSLIAVDNFT